MNSKNKNLKSLILNLKSNEGQALLIVTAFLGVILMFGFITVSNTMHFNRVTSIIDERAAAKEAAEAGLAKATWCLNQISGENCGGTFGSNYEGESDIFMGPTSFSTSITEKDIRTKTIESTGYYPNATSTRAHVTLRQDVLLNADTIQFHYGVQVGDGGLTMQNSAIIHGNVYSNNTVSGANSATIDGDVYVAGGSPPEATAEWTTQNDEFIFGRYSSAASVAQSFTVAEDCTVTKAQFYLKKVGGPSNATIRITGDYYGTPSLFDLRTFGTLSASKVTNEFGWVEESFYWPANLTAGTTYWLTIDPWGTNKNKYWVTGIDNTNAYPNGLSKYFQSSWPYPWLETGGDMNFKLWAGGVETSIENMTVTGDAHAHTIDSCDIGNDAFAQTITNLTTVGNDAYANEISTSIIYNDAYSDNIIASLVYGNEYPGQGETPPPPESMPISEGQITEWKSEATDGGVINGDYTPPAGQETIIGPKKITGSVDLTNQQSLRLTGALYIEGNLTIGVGAAIFLDESFGTSSGLVVVDGLIDIDNNVTIEGSGAEESVLMLLSTNPAENAIDISNSANAGVFYASNGGASLTQTTSVKELTAFKVNMENSAEIWYEQGLIQTSFTTGPGGAWTAKAGTWQIVE